MSSFCAQSMAWKKINLRSIDDKPFKVVGIVGNTNVIFLKFGPAFSEILFQDFFSFLTLVAILFRSETI